MVTVVGSEGIELSPAPIPKSWITGGAPSARNALVARSADRTALTLLWDCTPGSFRWIYDQDETIHVLEGQVTLTFEDGRSAELAAGSIVFFPAGCAVHWQVHRHVRKLAVFRETMPTPVALMVRLRARARQLMRERAPQRPLLAPRPVALPQAA